MSHSDIWLKYDQIYQFVYGFAKVNHNKKYNWINKD